jgi:hypothetical protein
MAFMENTNGQTDEQGSNSTMLRNKITTAVPNLFLLFLFLLISASSSHAAQTGIGISYNAATAQNEIYSIDPITGTSTFLQSVVFDNSGWTGHISVDLKSNRFYTLSAANRLYTFDLTSGALLVTVSLSPRFQAVELRSDGSMIGISYNAETAQNETYSIDPTTGASALLQSVVFDNSGWTGQISVDQKSTRFYTLSAANKLYTFDLTSGALLATISLSPRFQAVGLRGDGSLIGISYNAATAQNEIYSIDPVAGTSTFLQSVVFDNNGWTGYISVDQKSNRFYTLSAANKLYTFNLASGALLNTIALSPRFQAVMILQSQAGCYYLGDINCDNQIDISDVILVLRIALDLDPEKACSDINADGQVDISDVILTLRMALDLDEKRPC